jgi:hypothetical protein
MGSFPLEGVMNHAPTKTCLVGAQCIAPDWKPEHQHITKYLESTVLNTIYTAPYCTITSTTPRSSSTCTGPSA